MNATEDERRSLFLPDFCTQRTTLAIVLIVELTAFVLTLARQSVVVDFWTDLVRTSLFLLWIGITGAGLLCVLRRYLMRLSAAAGSAAVLGLIAALVALISACAYLIGRSHLVTDTGGAALFPGNPVSFALRNVWIGLVVTGLALRYFYVAHEWRRSIELRAAARVHALQARIRPHFLHDKPFNLRRADIEDGHIAHGTLFLIAVSPMDRDGIQVLEHRNGIVHAPLSSA